jgi:hypothetical protein
MSIDPKEIELGTKHEHEHTKDDALARKIAMDHLKDDHHYYTKLNKAGLEQEGAMTPLESGMDECGYDMPSVAIIQVSAEPVGQTSLNSSGLGKGGIATPLKTSNIKAPAEKAKIGANKVAMRKTPTMSGNTDPLDHYFGAAMEEGKNWPYDDEGKLEPEPKAKGDYQPHQHGKYSDMGGVDNPNGDSGDDNEPDPFRHAASAWRKDMLGGGEDE